MSDFHLSLINIEGKPFEKLIDTVSAGIGTLYNPRAIRKAADAKAYEIEKLAGANARANLINSDAELALLQRAQERLKLEETNRQINIENIAEKSFKYLPEKVSEKPVDSDWRTRFFNRCKDVSNEEMQDIWAKILAEEVTEPGRTSLRTLDIIANLTKEEAEIFEVARGMVFSCSAILELNQGDDFKDFGLSYDNVLILGAAGLVHEDTLFITFNLMNSKNPTENEGKGITRPFSGFWLEVSHPTKDTFGGRCIKLTTAGCELCLVLESNPNMEYYTKLVSVKEKEGYKFKIIED